MPIVPWKPFNNLARFFDDDDWLFPVFSQSELNKPAMNIKETSKEIVAEVDVPGFDPKNIEVTVEDNVLHVKGSFSDKKEKDEKGYWRKEIHRGSFERSVPLHVQIKENLVKASFNNGVLKIVMPKKKSNKKSKVKIRVEK